MNDVDTVVRSFAAALPPPRPSLENIDARARSRRRRRTVAVLAAVTALAGSVVAALPLLRPDPGGKPAPIAAAQTATASGPSYVIGITVIRDGQDTSELPPPNSSHAQLMPDGSIRYMPVKVPLGQHDPYVALPDGRFAIAEISGARRHLVIVDAAGEEQTRREISGNPPPQVYLSGGFAVIDNAYSARFQEITTGTERIIRKTGEPTFRPVYYSAGQSLIASYPVENDPNSCKFGLYDPKTGERVRTLSVGDRCTHPTAVISPDGTLLAVRKRSTDGGGTTVERVVIVDTADGRILRDEVAPAAPQAQPGQTRYLGSGWRDARTFTLAYGTAPTGQANDRRTDLGDILKLWNLPV